MRARMVRPADQFSLSRIILLFGLLCLFAVPRGFAQPKTPDAPTNGVPVFISDFELFSAPIQLGPAAPASAAAKQNPGSPVVYDDSDVPSTQARRLMDFFAVTLLQSLQKKGFQATRVTGENPSAGALIRGVFAEPDAKSRVRRALLGGTSPNSRFLLYVGIFNLARQDQPLYQLAPEQSPSSRYGPIITLNNYVPMAQYELDKNPSEEEVQKICNQIAASLASLLADNPDAFSK